MQGFATLVRWWTFSVKMAERASGSSGPEPAVPESDGAPWLPERIKAVLARAADFAAYKRARTFRFLRLFAGKNDVLGKAVQDEASKSGIQTEIRAIDWRGRDRDNLLADEPYFTLRREAKDGDWDACHAGPPRGTFSAARWSANGPGPPPVRSKTEMYGLATNSGALQRQADQGTLLATRSCDLVADVVATQRARQVPEAGTVENPPGSDGGPDGPMWMLPEVVAFIKDLDAMEAVFNTCAFQASSRLKWFKPGKFVGRLGGLQSLSRKCSCPAGFKHQPLVGKERTELAAEYPAELCREVAQLIVKAWKRTLDLEWWRFQVQNKKTEVSALQLKWLESKERQQKEQGEQRSSVKRLWAWTSTSEHRGPDNKLSKKGLREEENDLAVGGMRNPWAAVRRLSKVAETGSDLARLWRRFAGKNPCVLRAAKAYGGNGCRLEPDLVEAWKEEMLELLHGRCEAVNLKERIEFKSPLNANLWEAWQKMAADPEKRIATWARQGAPLGMSAEIPVSNIFPKAADVLQAPAVEEAQWRSAFKNYSSVEADPEGAAMELGHYLDKGFAKRMSKADAQQRFGSGTVSKLALIVKEKGDGTIKRRIIIDLLRSGGNDRARVPERIVLPRCTDFVDSVRRLWSLKDRRMKETDPLDELAQGSDDEDDGVEMVGADLSDACCHFGVAAEELKNCLAPALEEDEILVFCAMLFGFKGAPLIMGRLAAAMARLWQSMIMKDGELQLYMDDPLFAIIGPKSRRRGVLAMLLYTAAALGVQLAFRKGERGLRICWIGVQLEIVTNNKAPPPDGAGEGGQGAAGKNERVERQGHDRLSRLESHHWKAVMDGGDCSSNEVAGLHLVCGRGFGGGRHPERGRVHRAASRQDRRPKVGLVPTKRVELPRSWLQAFFEHAQLWLVRKEPLLWQRPEFLVVADASPMGVGAILAAADPSLTLFEPMVALKGVVTQELANFLGVPFGESGSQGPLEALALVLAVQEWRHKLRGSVVLIRSDSVVALAMVKKLAASSPALNFLGACLVEP